MKALFGDPLVQAVLLMIDWGARRIQLYPDRKDEPDRFVHLNDDQVARALMPHEERPDGFLEVEADIRTAFDRFLDGLERFHAYVQAGLVEDSDLAPYLTYWARQVYGEARPGTEDRILRLRHYIEKYGFEGAKSLLKRLAAA